jgi:hypothetical protein
MKLMLYEINKGIECHNASCYKKTMEVDISK